MTDVFRRCKTCLTLQPLRNFHPLRNTEIATHRGQCKTCYNYRQKLRARKRRLLEKGLYPDEPPRLSMHERALQIAIGALRANPASAYPIQIRGAIALWPDAMTLRTTSKGFEILGIETPSGKVEFNLSQWTLPGIAEALWIKGIEIPFPEAVRNTGA